MITPYQNEQSKKDQVATMFNNIAGKYDFLNHFFSLGIDILWRKRAVRILGKKDADMLLDVATGTGDFAIECLKLNPKKVMGIDISQGMLDVGKEKLKTKKLDHKIELLLGDSENLPFEDNTFDGETVAFGVRNFENLEKGLSEMLRVLKPGGKTVVLEFSKPITFPIKQLYFFYFRYIMPTLGKIVSKDNAAYTYLPESVMAFPERKNFLSILEKVGYKNTGYKAVTGGIACIYWGEK
jgi:demethylmenaquinone methyltransferase/2-methoxy-6-polyprenyl-1,4-benzoquinol methylase